MTKTNLGLKCGLCYFLFCFYFCCCSTLIFLDFTIRLKALLFEFEFFVFSSFFVRRFCRFLLFFDVFFVFWRGFFCYMLGQTREPANSMAV